MGLSKIERMQHDVLHRTEKEHMSVGCYAAYDVAAYILPEGYLQANNFKEKQQDNIISCFEHEYEENGIVYMDVYIRVDGVTKVDAFSQFN